MSFKFLPKDLVKVWDEAPSENKLNYSAQIDEINNLVEKIEADTATDGEENVVEEFRNKYARGISGRGFFCSFKKAKNINDIQPHTVNLFKYLTRKLGALFGEELKGQPFFYKDMTSVEVRDRSEVLKGEKGIRTYG